MGRRQLWEVVGGKDKGGIVVREGRDLKSPVAGDRLSTGAVVRELALDGERLQYERVSGTGPAKGWVSVRLRSGGDVKDLLVRKQAEEGPAPATATATGTPPATAAAMGAPSAAASPQQRRGAYSAAAAARTTEPMAPVLGAASQSASPSSSAPRTAPAAEKVAAATAPAPKRRAQPERETPAKSEVPDRRAPAASQGVQFQQRDFFEATPAPHKAAGFSNQGGFSQTPEFRGHQHVTQPQGYPRGTSPYEDDIDDPFGIAGTGIDDDGQMEVAMLEIDGQQFMMTPDGMVIDPETQQAVGMFNPETQSIEPLDGVPVMMVQDGDQTYIVGPDGMVYDPTTQEQVGMFNPDTQEIEPLDGIRITESSDFGQGGGQGDADDAEEEPAVNIEFWDSRGDELSRKGNLRGAASSYTTALRHCERSRMIELDFETEIVRKRAVCWEKLGDRTQLLADAERILEADADDAQALAWRQASAKKR